MQLERIAWPGTGTPQEPALRRQLEEEGFAVWSWSDQPHASYTPHTHDCDESLWVLAGTITFAVDGREYPLQAGDRLMLPAGTVHAAVTGSQGATYLVGERKE